MMRRLGGSDPGTIFAAICCRLCWAGSFPHSDSKSMIFSKLCFQTTVTLINMNATRLMSVNLYPSSDNGTNDSSQNIRAHYHPYLRPAKIREWVSDVQEAMLLPPLITIPSPQYPNHTYNQPSQRGRFFQISFPIPRQTASNIRSQITNALRFQSPRTILEQLHHPKTLPLVSNIFLFFLFVHFRLYLF